MNPQLNTVSSSDYAQYCQPRLSEMLNIAGLDKHYFKGEGSRLWYHDDDGSEKEVIDFLGGYGSTLLGHNHPQLVAHAVAMLQGGMVHHGQLGMRRYAGELGRRLAQHMQATTGRPHMVLQANSGAEAVELALKLAEFGKRARIERLQKRIDGDLYEAARAANEGLNMRAADLAILHDLLGEIASTLPLSEQFALLAEFNHKAASARPVLLGLERAFHGKTTGALQLTNNTSYRQPFERLGAPVHFLEPGMLEAVQEVIASSTVYLHTVLESDGELILQKQEFSNVSAFFVEPIQGEGGVHPLDIGYLQGLRACADAHDFPLVLDEIQTGMGRTGSLLYAEQLGIRGDICLLGKSLGGALAKISAILVDQEWYEPEFGLLHSSTFAEDDYSSSLACRVLDVIEQEGLLEQCASKGRKLTEALYGLQQAYPEVIREVRGAGLLLGLEFMPREHGSTTLRDIFMEGRLGYVIAGYLLNKHGIRVAPTLSSPATIRLEPAALITDEECQKLMTALTHVCEILRRKNAYEMSNYIIGNRHVPALDEMDDYRAMFPHATSTAEIDAQADAQVNVQKKVAFLGHLSIISNLRHWDPSLANFSDAEASAWLRKLSPMVGPLVHKSEVIESITGERVLLEFITLYFDSEMIVEQVKAGKQHEIRDCVQRAVDYAVERGCEAIGFGGYSSVVTGNCKRVQLRQDVALTSGNSLTVAMGIQALLDTAAEQGIALEQSCFAAVGAAGNIASIYSELMASHVPRLLLIGTSGSVRRMQQLAKNIYDEAFEDLLAKRETGAVSSGVPRALAAYACVDKLLALPAAARPVDIGAYLYQALQDETQTPPIRISENLDDLTEANLILSASTTPAALIYPQHIAEGPVVICDIAVPLDVDASVREQCSNVVVIQGGMVRLPLDSAYTIPGIPLEPGLAFACNAETIVMGFANLKSHYSYGKITKDQVQEISRLAKLHGLTLARPRLEASY